MSNLFWDRKKSNKEIKIILKDGKHEEFIEYAALLLSRSSDVKQIFSEYIKALVFCNNWNRIKRRMRKNKWSDNKITFWDEVYKNALELVDKDKLNIRKENNKLVNEKVKKIGEKLRQIRIKKGWTQKEAAQKMGISQQTISSIETGSLNYSIETLLKVIDALDIVISISNKKDTTRYDGSLTATFE